MQSVKERQTSRLGARPVERLRLAEQKSAGTVAVIGGVLDVLTSSLLNALAGVVAGGLALAGVMLVKRVYAQRR